MVTSDTSLFSPPECLREHQQDHVGGEPPGRGRPLRLHADQTDLGSAGSGLEELRRGAGRALHHPRHVLRLPPEGRTGAATGSPPRVPVGSPLPVAPSRRDGVAAFRSVRFPLSIDLLRCLFWDGWHGNGRG